MARRRSNGEGSMYLREDGLWCAQITLPDGKRKYKYGKTQKEVKDWLLEQRKLVNDGLLTTSEDSTFGAFLDRYLTEIAPQSCKAHTIHTYGVLIKHHIRPELGEVKLSKLRPDQLQHLYHTLSLKGLSKQTVHHVHSIIKHTLSYALKWGLVPRNVALAVDAGAPQRKAPVVWSRVEVQKFLEASKNHPLYALFLVAITTGLRKGEILALTWSAVDVTAGAIQVKQAAHFLKGEGMIMSEPKTEKSRRLVTVPLYVIEALRTHRIDQEERKSKAGDRWSMSDLVFTNRHGKLLDSRNLHDEWKDLIDAAGLPEIRFHDLRHTHATMLLVADVHPKIVQERLGHSSIRVTLDTYSHTIPSMQGEAMKHLDDLVGR